VIVVTKIDVFSGFLGAGKTTLIKKLISESFQGEKLVLIENEFGEIGIDGGFLKEAGVQITEMNSGCICCSLVGDFTVALQKVLDDFSPDRILIEPSGVGKLSDVIKAVQQVASEDVKLNSFTTIADASKCRIYSKNFGEFYNDQIQNAGCIVLSRTGGMSQEKLEACVDLLRQLNADATIITTPWDLLNGDSIVAAMEGSHSLSQALAELSAEAACPVCGHHHHHHDEKCCHEHEHHHHHDEKCCHEHEHHHHHDEECCHEHEHHHHHDEECCHEHEHHHHHDEEGCHEHEHHHHHHHHADDVFASWGVETTKAYSPDEVLAALQALDHTDRFGVVLRAKGIVAGADGHWIHFDYVPGEPNVRTGGAEVIGRVCVIGSELRLEALECLFGVAHKKAE